MPTRYLRSSLYSIIGAVGLGAAFTALSCERNPNPNVPSSSAGISVVRVELNAPAEIAPEASVQLTARAVKSDNSIEDVTSLAQWTSSNRGIVDVSSGGVASGIRRGEAQVSARYDGRSASARLFVLPAGTFRLDGRITEDGYGVRDVRVTVVSGVGEGLTAATSESGNYVLYGVSGRVRLQARKEGYVDAIEEMEISRHTTHRFELTPERPVRSLAGAYTLTVIAGGCRAGMGTLPDAAKRRNYLAAISQDHRQLTVVLSGADFVVANGRGDRFPGFVDASDRVFFEIGNVGLDYDYNPRCYLCDLVERLTPDTALVVGGNVAATATPSDIMGTLFGAFWLAEGASPPLNRFSAHCDGVHGFELRRR
jgi:hypothetical protein